MGQFKRNYDRRAASRELTRSALDRVQAALREAGSENIAGDDWTCPTHDDERASLTVKYGTKPGRVVLACGAGCTTDAVLAHLGLTKRDLFDPDEIVGRKRHIYLDESGEPLFRVTRFQLASGTKTFGQQGSNDRGGWRKGKGSMDDVQRVLYRLPELRKAIKRGGEVHLSEGESDADALNEYFQAHDIDAFATCHPGGAGKWATWDDYLPSLVGAERLVVWGDRDAAGYRCCLQRLRAVLAAGLHARAVLPIPDHEKADARDHLEAGHSPAEAKPTNEDELVRLVQESSEAVALVELDDATIREANRLRARRAAVRLVDAEEAAGRALVLPRRTLRDALAAERPDEPPERISKLHRVGYNTTVTAKFKTGKTTLGGNMLRSLADGDPFLERFEVVQPDGLVGLLNYELTDADMLDWLIDQDIHRTERVAILNLRGQRFSLASERNQEELIRWCRDMGVEVLHLDPHRRAFAGFGSENSNDDVNRFTDVLDVIKTEAGVRDLFLYVHTGRVETEAGAEHARGATALDDWADQRVVLTKDDHEDRFMYVDGRMDFVPEFRLVYERANRRLSAADGNRRENSIDKYRTAILNALEVAAEDGAAVGALEEKLAVKKKGALSSALAELVRDGLIVQRKRGNAKVHWLMECAPQERS